MTPDHLRAQADQLDAEALELGKAGQIHEGVVKLQEAANLRRMAKEVEAMFATSEQAQRASDWASYDAVFQDAKGATTLIQAKQHGEQSLLNAKQKRRIAGMTSVQAAERAQAISKAKAGKDPFLKLVSKSKWRSQNRYARLRLKISPAMLTGYRKGVYPVPQHIQTAIFEDLGIRIGRSE